MEWGCEQHGGLDGLAPAEPGCKLCYAFLQGSRDALRQEVNRWKAMHDAASDKLAIADLQIQEQQKIVDAASALVAEEAKRGEFPFQVDCLLSDLRDAIKGKAEKPKSETVPDTADAEPTGANQHARSGLCWCSLFHDMG